MRKSSMIILVTIFISILMVDGIHAATLFVDRIDDGLLCTFTLRVVLL